LTEFNKIHDDDDDDGASMLGRSTDDVPCE